MSWKVRTKLPKEDDLWSLTKKAKFLRDEMKIFWGILCLKSHEGNFGRNVQSYNTIFVY